MTFKDWVSMLMCALAGCHYRLVLGLVGSILMDHLVLSRAEIGDA